MIPQGHATDPPIPVVSPVGVLEELAVTLKAGLELPHFWTIQERPRVIVTDEMQNNERFSFPLPDNYVSMLIECF